MRLVGFGSAVAEAKGGGLPCGEEARQAGQSQRTAVDPIYGLSSVGSRPSEDLWMWKAGGFHGESAAVSAGSSFGT